MPVPGNLLEEALRAARHGDWLAYRSRFAALREALQSSEDEELRVRLDILNAAAPEHDPEGCMAELELLAPLVAGQAPAAAEARPPAPPLDLRGLAPPQPMVRILEALERAPGAPLRVILPHEPLPLYSLLRERGYSFRGAPRADGGFELFIEPV